jgi:hypothetical protein
MQNRRRSLIVVVLLLAGAAGWWAYARWTAAREHVPGTYVGTSWDDSETVVVEFLPDGEAHREVYAPGAAQPRLTARGRWRVTGSLLVLEEGPAALAPVGLSDSVAEMFADPLISPDVSRFRLVSADDEGLVLGLGGEAQWVLRRKP